MMVYEIDYTDQLPAKCHQLLSGRGKILPLSFHP